MRDMFFAHDAQTKDVSLQYEEWTAEEAEKLIEKMLLEGAVGAAINHAHLERFGTTCGMGTITNITLRLRARLFKTFSDQGVSDGDACEKVRELGLVCGHQHIAFLRKKKMLPDTSHAAAQRRKASRSLAHYSVQLPLVEKDRRNKVTPEEIGTKLELITPDIATKYLERNLNNRRTIQTHIDFLESEILSGNWEITNQGIAFDNAGRLIDGQHRLLAVVNAGMPVHMLVTRGLSPDSQFTIDKVRPRRLYQDLQMISGGEAKYPGQAAAALRMAVCILTGSSRSLNTIGSYEQSMLVFGDGLTFAVDELAGNRVMKVSSIMGAVVFAYKKDPEFVMDFTRRFVKGSDLHEGSPILILRNDLFTHTKPRTNFYSQLELSHRILNVAYMEKTGEKVRHAHRSQLGVEFFRTAYSDIVREQHYTKDDEAA